MLQRSTDSAVKIYPSYPHRHIKNMIFLTTVQNRHQIDPRACLQHNVVSHYVAPIIRYPVTIVVRYTHTIQQCVLYVIVWSLDKLLLVPKNPYRLQTGAIGEYDDCSSFAKANKNNTKRLNTAQTNQINNFTAYHVRRPYSERLNSHLCHQQQPMSPPRCTLLCRAVCNNGLRKKNISNPSVINS